MDHFQNKFKQTFFDIQKLSEQEKKLLFGEATKKYKALDNSRRFTLSGEVNSENIQDLQKTTDQQALQNKSCEQKLIISIDNKYKTVWDIFVLLLIAYSNITTSYYVAFGAPVNIGVRIFEGCVEICFLLDIIMRFFHEYRDPENLDVVSNLKDIAKNYLKTWFIFDFLAIFPFPYILPDQSEQGKYVTKLVRLIRLPKFMRLLDSSKFDQLLDAILERETTNPSQEKSRQEKMNIKYIARYIYKIIRLILMSIMLTYFLGCFWYFLSSSKIFGDFEETFISKYELENYPDIVRLIKCCYFVLTTLATVGYGDLSPRSNLEKIFGILLMIVGIAFFSYIMGNFNDVVLNYDKKMGNVDKGQDLQIWLTTLSKFINQKPIPRGILKSIDEHFKFFWKHDRLSNLSMDDKYLTTIPKGMRIQLINYLFEDIYSTFRTFLHKKDFPNSELYYDIAFLFLPRKYEAKQMIIKQGGNVQEIYFVLEGEVELWFETNNKHKIGRYFSKGYFFGDYNVFNDKKSEYNYTATSLCKVLALPKYKFLKLMKKYPDIRKAMVDTAAQLRFQAKNRFLKMLDSYYNVQLPAEEKKLDPDFTHIKCTEADILKKYNQFVTEKIKQAQDAQEVSVSATQFSMQTLNDIESKLKDIDTFLSEFEENVNKFKTVVESELDDITKNLENIKSKLIEKRY